MFARHKLGGGEYIVEWIRENHYIAINWDDSPSTDREEYGSDGRSRAYQEIGRMNRVASDEHPTVVGAHYGNKVNGAEDRMVLGRVDPDADVHIIHYEDDEQPPAVYESERDARKAGVPDAHEQAGDDDLDGEWVYKALPLIGCEDYNEPVEVSFVNYPILSALRPRYHSFCEWHVAKHHLRAIDAGASSFRDVEGDIDEPSDLLAPSQLEVVCNQYLRQSSEYTGYKQLLSVGRTLRDVDIVGQTEEGRLFAQVTKDTGSNLQDKADALGTYNRPETSNLVLFGPRRESLTLPDGVMYTPLDEVVDAVDNNSPEFLTTMYDLPEPDEFLSLL